MSPTVTGAPMPILTTHLRYVRKKQRDKTLLDYSPFLARFGLALLIAMLRLATNQLTLDISCRNKHNRGMNQLSRDLIHLKGKNRPRIAAIGGLGRVLAARVNQSGVE
ncbi:hypothetical protein CBX96_12445 [Shewanella sp. BC20]|nr:hypothetical protein CBX96_12445 [Shewanella sp. BC20]